MEVIGEPGQKGIFCFYFHNFSKFTVVSKCKLKQIASSPVPGPGMCFTSGSFPFSPVQCGDGERRSVSQCGAGDAKPDLEPGGGQRSPQEPGEAPEAASSGHQQPPLSWR